MATDFPTLMVQALASTTSDLEECNHEVEASFSNPPQSVETTQTSLLEASAKLEAQFIDDATAPSRVTLLLRSTKNLLRWILQFMEPSNETLVVQSNEMLSIYKKHVSESLGDVSKQEICRHATLCLFYGTYGRTKSLEYVADQLDYLSLLVRLFSTSTTTTSVILGNLRLLHNLLVSLPGFAKRCSRFEVEIDNQEAPWLKVECTSVQILLVNILEWCLQDLSQDRKLEVTTEILRILYVLQAGRTMEASLLKELLGIPECRLATITLLMDAPIADFKDDLTEFQPLILQTLEQQVSLVVTKTLVGSTAASALTPILVLTRNLSMASPEFCAATKKHIFPNDISPSCNPAAMSPADAPRGTLRAKCIQILTWTESHVKRLMAELLWTLCGEKAQEFSARVGMGNAMTQLNAKGLVDLPTGS